ncbi:pilus (MSHA type) biogenesis protein MshL [Alteromonas stellipolaris]|uniref:Pilus (MSHA type) biogenesis protein MshL n=1 Tax=Alteromonas stellipolaris TaxID=233316 RepID=A0AAW7YZ08_9ALTE|nr:pilus (MSHA type) biogenesis protein MshL [Alteromonas stellipolaris]MDO6577431.1 pilus (MSHA type) biogenesis protein MshL [Alteromonas stellipolaris]
MGKLPRLFGVLSIALAMTGCQSTSEPQQQLVSKVEQDLQEQIDAEKARKSSQVNTPVPIPSAVSAALAAPESVSSTNSLFGPQRFDVNAQSVPISAFFAGLVEGTPYSVAIHPQVTGSVSLQLKQVTIDEVMSLLSDLYGYDIARSGTVFKVRAAGMRTETFAVNYLYMQRSGATQTSITSGGVTQNNNQNNNNGSSSGSYSGNFSSSDSYGSQNNSNTNGTTINTRTETDFWADLKVSLEAMVGKENGRAVFVTPQASLVTVRAMPDELSDIRRFLKTSEANLTKQVILEARILEVELNDGYQQGINWNEILANTGNTDFSLSTTAGTLGNDISTTLGGVTSLAFLNKDFSGVLSLLSTQGNVQVLSSPRVTAINNQKAVIKVGDDEYFVTDVSSDSTVTSTTTSISPDIELTPFFSGIALDVTPQIDDKGTVLLHVHPSVIETAEQQKVVTMDDEQIVLPLAQSTIRESDTIIRAGSGEIVVIGGLMQTSQTDMVSKTPLLGDIPLFGELFKNRQVSETKKELIILLKPTVVGHDTFEQQLETSRQNMVDWLYVD